MFLSITNLYRYTFCSILLFLATLLITPSLVSTEALRGENIHSQVVQQVEFGNSNDYSVVLA